MDKKSRELVMAKLYFKNKDFKMAEKSFNEYLSMNPEDVTALKLLAQVYEQNKRYDKSFEMYERCYLAEPDRTGVLLDICRILLMNEVWLEHVDYRKWLNLAIKSFPSNPIVVNFKAFLSTLPDDQSSNQHQVTTRTSTRGSGSEDIIVKILDKLSLMESRLERIENKLNERTENKSDTRAENRSDVRIENRSDPRLESRSDPRLESRSDPRLESRLDRSIEPKSDERVENKSNEQASGPINLIQTQHYVAPVQPIVNVATTVTTLPSATPPAFNFSSMNISGGSSGGGGNLFADSLKKLNLPTDGWTTQSNSPFGLSRPKESTTNNSLFGLSKPQEDTTSNSSFGFSKPKEDTTNFSSFSFSKPKEDTPSFSSFSFSKPKEGTPSYSPFSFSKPKEDIPSYSPFSFSNPPKENPKGEEGDGEDGEVVPNEELAIENTCDMEPIEIKTGEEDEDILFEHRCKLFRLRDKEYKERGLGSIKVLKHKTTGKGRLIMRREAIGLVCLNCWDCSKIERVRDNQIRFVGIDASDGEPELTIFLVKFKTAELTDTFMSHLSNLFLNESSSTNTSLSSPQPKADKLKNDTTNSNTGGEPEVELIDPKIDQSLVDKARKLQLPDLFYHKLKNQEPCGGCNGCEKDE